MRKGTELLSGWAFAGSEKSQISYYRHDRMEGHSEEESVCPKQVPSCVLG